MRQSTQPGTASERYAAVFSSYAGLDTVDTGTVHRLISGDNPESENDRVHLRKGDASYERLQPTTKQLDARRGANSWASRHGLPTVDLDDLESLISGERINYPRLETDLIETWCRTFATDRGYSNPETQSALEAMLNKQTPSNAQLLALYFDRSKAITESGRDQVATLETDAARAATLMSNHHVNSEVFQELMDHCMSEASRLQEHPEEE